MAICNQKGYKCSLAKVRRETHLGHYELWRVWLFNQFSIALPVTVWWLTVCTVMLLDASLMGAFTMCPSSDDVLCFLART